MKTRTKAWLIVAASLVLIGGIMFGGVMAMLKWDFTKLSTAKYETNIHELNENYKNITITTDTADITFVPSSNDNSAVTCYEQKNLKHSVIVKDDTLIIELVDTRKWYEHIGILGCTPKITLAIPQGEYSALSIKASTGDVEIPKEYLFASMDISESTGDVTVSASARETIKIKTSTGGICLESISASALNLSVTTGKVTINNTACEGDINIHVSTGKTNMTNIRCKNLIAEGNTGDLSLKQVVASEKFSIQRTTGDVKFDSCDAAEIFVKTETGDVRGYLLTDKIFYAETDTGKIDIPKTATGGKCEIYTDTGDIKISIG